MKITVITILLALGAIGCQTSNDNVGAPPPGYETDTGERPVMGPEPYRNPTGPDAWQHYRYEGITPITPP